VATKANKLLWITLCVAQLIYLVVVYTMPPPQDPQAVAGGIFPALLFAAISIAVGTLIYRRRALVVPIQSGRLDLNTQQGLAKAFTPYILNLVLSEAVAIYGLVLSMLSGEFLYTVGFVAAGLSLLYLHRPTAPELQSPFARPEGGDRPSPIA
jgi:hypothetical protein